MTQAQTNSLQTVIGEFKNLSPEISNVFIFKADNEIVASNEATSEEQSKNLISAFNSITQKAEVIGRIETVTMRGADRQLQITSINNRFLATVSSHEADEKIIKSLTCVLVPTVVKLVNEIASQTSENAPPQECGPEVKQEEEIISLVQQPPVESVTEEPVTFSSDPPLPEPPVTQFMVEKNKAFLAPSDLVRVDPKVIAKWNNLYVGKQIVEVHIETLEGKTATCKVKRIKDPNINPQGIIQIPDKLLQTLQTSKGKLVIVKPVIPSEEAKN